MDSKFNLIDEPWIPINGRGLVGLEDIFTDRTLTSLGGTPIEKIALTKLFLAIAQAAITPDNESEWESLGVEGLATKCRAYLAQWHHRFYLYGDEPFLQVPAIKQANVQSFGALLPEVSTGNTTVLTHSNMEKNLADHEKARLLVTLMSMALGGKKTDNSITLSSGYRGKLNTRNKPSTSKPAPGLAYLGLLHTFINAQTLLETLWFNLLTHQQLSQINLYPEGVGTAPWESMPKGENCLVARSLSQSLMGRLVPISRFCLIVDDGLHYSEGIAYANYKEGSHDLSISVKSDGKLIKALWASPSKRPWRELSSLLSFLSKDKNTGFQCMQLRLVFHRMRRKTENFSIWSGGLRVSSNAGEQYVTGGDDFVESRYQLKSENLGKNWFAQFKNEMDALDKLSKILYAKVMQYHTKQKVDGGPKAAAASNQFWQLCERYAQMLIDSCNQTDSTKPSLKDIRKRFANFISKTYDQFCPRHTARQMADWAECRPNISQYLKNGGDI